MGFNDVVGKGWKGVKGSGNGVNVGQIVQGGSGQKWDDKVVRTVHGPLRKCRGVGLHQGCMEQVEWKVATAGCGAKLENVCILRVICARECVDGARVMHGYEAKIEFRPEELAKVIEVWVEGRGQNEEGVAW